MKLKKKEHQSVDTLILLRRGNKILTEGVTETNFGSKMKGWTIETAISDDASHNQPLNADTIAYISKILLKGP